MLYLTNTLTHKKQLFTPLNNAQVTLYVCGITPYDYTHVGHGRCYVVFDCLYRIVRFLGHNVVYCRNFTDIDDKLLHKATQQFGDQFRYAEIAQAMIADFHKMMKRLHCIAPTYEPRVTENIEPIIAFINGLIAKGYAYEAQGSVYFAIDKYPQYGALSGQKVDELRAGVRVDIAQGKKDPLDFALWKAEEAGTFWQSPWGWGRPGWHIECSALAAEYLGASIDIHGGGLDLVFPHHENEIAQSQALHGDTFAHIWMHSGLVFSQKQKMSKSLGNVFMLGDILEQYDPMVLRLYYYTVHYRTPLDFATLGLESAQKNYQRLSKLFAPIEAEAITRGQITPEDYPLVHDLIVCLEDDINTASMIGLLFEHVTTIIADKKQGPVTKYLLQNLLGLSLEPLAEKEQALTPAIEALIVARQQARQAKDFKRADELRAQLEELGYHARDGKID